LQLLTQVIQNRKPLACFSLFGILEVIWHFLMCCLEFFVHLDLTTLPVTAAGVLPHVTGEFNHFW